VPCFAPSMSEIDGFSSFSILETLLHTNGSCATTFRSDLEERASSPALDLDCEGGGGRRPCEQRWRSAKVVWGRRLTGRWFSVSGGGSDMVEVRV
jgi:hypothetical protein